MAEICEQGEKVMLATLWIVLTYPLSFCHPRQDLALEFLALRHQLMVLQRQVPRPKAIETRLVGGSHHQCLWQAA